MHRLWVVSQHDWEGKEGFYIDFENYSQDKSPCKLENLVLALGVADGREWRFIALKHNWELGKDYKLKAEINEEEARLFLNDELKGESRGAFKPAEIRMLINHSPLWDRSKTDYLIIIKNIHIRTGSQDLSFSFYNQLPLYLFEPQDPRRLDIKTEGMIEIESSFTIINYPNPRSFAPLVDCYGQLKLGNWDGKIKTDDDLRKVWEEEKAILEAWGEPEGYDRFGGYKLAGWKEKGTGFYRVIKREGFWWLITPEGNPCFYLGLCAIPTSPWEISTPVSGREFIFEDLPPKEGDFSPAWFRGFWGNPEVEYFNFHISNMIRKYGKDWKSIEEELTRRRLKVWGFSGGGKWGRMENLPYFPVLNRSDVPVIIGHPDIFDPKVREIFKESLRKQIEPFKEDPYLVGWSLGNEYDEVIRKDEIREILGKRGIFPAKVALIDYALENLYRGDYQAMAKSWKLEGIKRDEIYGLEVKPPDRDLVKLCLFYAGKYYKFISKTIKELDPNHLFLGFWFVPGWWEKEDYWEIFKLSARYCDVIGYNLGAYEFMNERFSRLVKEEDKPIICGDFSFPAFYHGQRGFGIWGEIWVDDDKEAGEFYQRWVEEGARNPYCLGLLWFFYIDQPITGRGPCDLIEEVVKGTIHPEPACGEHYAFGMVDITDTPKWELVRRAREANLSAIQTRLKATKTSYFSK
ncbi:glycosyl hydrolase [bacterium]|nr:glycosyl hydrolase [bacterium]